MFRNRHPSRSRRPSRNPDRNRSRARYNRRQARRSRIPVRTRCRSLVHRCHSRALRNRSLGRSCRNPGRPGRTQVRTCSLQDKYRNRTSDGRDPASAKERRPFRVRPAWRWRPVAADRFLHSLVLRSLGQGPPACERLAVWARHVESVVAPSASAVRWLHEQTQDDESRARRRWLAPGSKRPFLPVKSQDVLPGRSVALAASLPRRRKSDETASHCLRCVTSVVRQSAVSENGRARRPSRGPSLAGGQQ